GLVNLLQAGTERHRIGDRAVQLFVGPGAHALRHSGPVFLWDIPYGNRAGAHVPVSDPLHQLAQLAKITGIFPTDEKLAHRGIDLRRLPGEASIQEVGCEQEDILFSLPQWQSSKHPTGDAVIQVQPELPAPHKLAEVPV